MKNASVTRKAVFDFDEPVFVTIDYYGDERKFEVTGGQVVESTVREDDVSLRGYRLTKAGKRRAKEYGGTIYIPTETGVMVDGEYQWIATPAQKLLEKVRTIGINLLNDGL